ncbi:SIR2 family NAD-dependent protein deacylase [Cohaesibacter gelatinilyticus]|uniref:protein acetyllysine N-acetyltransferase n=1 Tax=Cohaesibacter gelatinilyticus TaxID=372072 RepID=A0A285ND94_9HYPH|nr:Sir2 family NAD-dependent protein deacetylase [Cohaesibacter gelatinilyticus]SNZ07494.1 NAD-dependent deacetylase [Cohaesibacter gelatinilyticus]
MDFKSRQQILLEAINAASNIIVFTGAGISTESGVPDYRSPGGLWHKFEPIMYEDFVSSEETRREDWRRRFILNDEFKKAEPNNGHLAIVELQKQNRLLRVITQNVDGLHQRSGLSDDNVIELHGNCTYATCLTCAKPYSFEKCHEKIETTDQSPLCDECGGLLKAAVINFGQAMPLDAMMQAEDDARACDLFIVLGSSLQVYPAAALPQIAKRNGAKLFIINRDPTPLDHLADFVLNAELGRSLHPLII